MRAWAKVCALLVLVLAMAIAACAGGEKARDPICPPGKKACQVGEGDDYICIKHGKNCPSPLALPRSLCPDGKKACQIGVDEYVCIDPDDECR